MYRYLILFFFLYFESLKLYHLLGILPNLWNITFLYLRIHKVIIKFMLNSFDNVYFDLSYYLAYDIYFVIVFFGNRLNIFQTHLNCCKFNVWFFKVVFLINLSLLFVKKLLLILSSWYGYYRNFQLQMINFLSSNIVFKLVNEY